MFSPVVDSLRSIQRVSELEKMRHVLSCKRVSLSSLSESVRVFDPEILQEIISKLAVELGPHAHDARLVVLSQTSTLVDDIVAGNSYVCCVVDKSSYQILKQRELTPEVRTANIIWDAVVELEDKPE